MSRGDRWEVGAAYPLLLPLGEGLLEPAGESRLFGSGRQAVRALLEFGRREYGWTSVYVPAYYSPSVVPHIADVLPVRRYDSGPMGPPPRPQAGPSDVVIAASYFGEPPAVAATAATLVVDVTHDPIAPWLDEVRADYFFASLHKTLPLPDGGLLWSGGAAELGSSTVSGISDFSREALRILPAALLRRRRIENAEELASSQPDLAGVRVHVHTFGVVLEFDCAERREAVRRGLIGKSVYPAVLWELSPQDVPPHQLDLSRRLLHLHADARWSGEDMHRVAEIVRGLCEQGTARRLGSCRPSPSPPNFAQIGRFSPDTALM